ncbi:MAG: cytochrome c oxidase assembly protein, partial [Chloroflexota bacterium]|nr:cytochrome c oxidase assembly protein [Chloroflexota bacterium]
ANIEGILIGAPLTFADHVVYRYYATVPRVMGMSALTDQQLGGLIMWIPTHVLWLVALLAVLVRWFEGDGSGVVRLSAVRWEAR